MSRCIALLPSSLSTLRFLRRWYSCAVRPAINCMLWAMASPPVSFMRCTWFVVLGVEALLAVIAGYFLYAEQLNARMLGGVALVVAATLLLRLP